MSLFLVTSKRDLVVKISWEFKRNIVHISMSVGNPTTWKIDKTTVTTWFWSKPRFGVEREFCDVILHKCYVQQTCLIWTIFLLNSREIFTTKSRFDVTRKSVTSHVGNVAVIQTFQYFQLYEMAMLNNKACQHCRPIQTSLYKFWNIEIFEIQLLYQNYD